MSVDFTFSIFSVHVCLRKILIFCYNIEWQEICLPIHLIIVGSYDACILRAVFACDLFFAQYLDSLNVNQFIFAVCNIIPVL